MIKINEVGAERYGDYGQHLKNLSDQDKYTRFGYQINNAAIDAVILDMVYNSDLHHLFLAVDCDNRILGFGHLAKLDNDWELAVSVEKEHQGQGTANSLMSYMIAWGKIHGVHSVYMHCIAENRKIQHLARKHGLRTVQRSGSELTAKVQLPEPTILDYSVDFAKKQGKLTTDILRLQRTWFRNWLAPK